MYIEIGIHLKFFFVSFFFHLMIFNFFFDFVSKGHFKESHIVKYLLEIYHDFSFERNIFKCLHYEIVYTVKTKRCNLTMTHVQCAKKCLPECVIFNEIFENKSRVSLQILRSKSVKFNLSIR